MTQQTVTFVAPHFDSPDAVTTGHTLTFANMPRVLDNEGIQALIPEQFQ